MPELDEMTTLEARLGSFKKAPTSPKRRNSHAKGQKAKGWPHKTPTVESLAASGFFYAPDSTHPDNTACFHCGSQIDGWEQDDDPTEEHLKLSSDCAWAILMGASSGSKDPTEMENPADDRLLQARKETFKSNWPHEKKRGWVCKTEQMAAAGLHYTPTVDSEDAVSCAYCKLAMDGWEPKDSPFEEHLDRAPGCTFFAFAGTSAPKPSRGKKSRVSKASRLSTQSNVTSISQAPSIPDLEESIDGSDVSQSTIISTTSTMASKKGAKGKGRSKAKTRDSTNVSVTDISTTKTRGTKRTSDQVSETDHAGRESTVKPEPPAKRRNTRSRASSMQAVDYPTLPQAEALKAARGGRKRASTRSRKASTTSMVVDSSAIIPNDEELDAALEADLDRVMEDQPNEVPEAAKLKAKGRGKKAAAPKKNTRNTQEPAAEDTQQDVLSDVEVLEVPESDVEPTAGRKAKGKKPATKKGGKKTVASTDDSIMSTRSHAKNTEDTIDSSMVTAHSTIDDSGHETDASVASTKTVTRKGSKKKAATRGKGKKAPASKNIEDIIQSKPETQNEDVVAQPAEADLDMAESEAEVEPVAEVKPKKAAKAKVKAKTTSKKTKVPQLSMPGMFSPLMSDMDPSFNSILAPSSPPIITSRLGLGADKLIPLSIVRSSSPKMRVSRQKAQNTSTFVRSPSPAATPRPPTTDIKDVFTPSPSPQQSDAENQPPSSLPPSSRPPLRSLSPNKAATTFAPGTPSRKIPLSPSKIGGGLRSEVPWTAADVEMVFESSMPGKENALVSGLRAAELTTPEARMTVEEWIKAQAEGAEEELKTEAERVVGIFESEGGKALRVLEGIEVAE